MGTLVTRKPAASFALIGVIFSIDLLAYGSAASAQSVRERDEASRVLTVERVAVADGEVTGDVVNHSNHAVRDVQLFIRYTWLWDNEFKPGTNDPGTSVYYTLAKEIPPGGRAALNFKPSTPLVKAAGGHFETSVTIAGFTEVIPQSR
jgi:hypothetical protein